MPGTLVGSWLSFWLELPIPNCSNPTRLNDGRSGAPCCNTPTGFSASLYDPSRGTRLWFGCGDRWFHAFCLESSLRNGSAHSRSTSSPNSVSIIGKADLRSKDSRGFERARERVTGCLTPGSQEMDRPLTFRRNSADRRFT